MQNFLTNTEFCNFLLLKTPAISISELSKYYQFNCDKLLKNILEKNSKKEQNLLKNESNALHLATIDRGFEFEKQIVNKLTNVVNCQVKNSLEPLEMLKRAQVGQIFYQLKLEVPETLYDKLNIKGIVQLRSFIPDFIKVTNEDGKRKLMIIDAKSSKSMRISHQVHLTYFMTFLII